MKQWTELDICNLALSKMGELLLTSTADSSREGLLCRLWFPVTFSQVLRTYKPEFAVVEVESTIPCPIDCEIVLDETRYISNDLMYMPNQMALGIALKLAENLSEPLTGEFRSFNADRVLNECQRAENIKLNTGVAPWRI